MGEEFIKIFSLIQSLSSTVSGLKNTSPLVDFIKKEMQFKTSNRKNANKSKNKMVKLLRKGQVLQDNEGFQAIKEKFDLQNEEIIVYHKIDINGIIYTSSNQTNKNSDSCFISSNGFFGLTEYFFNHKEKCYVLAKKIVRLCNPFFCDEHQQKKASLHYCHISTEVFIEEVEKIKKLALIKVDDSYFISDYSISHLFN